MQSYRDMARFYDAENRDRVEDLPLYEELFEETGGPVLDVGCGTGRVAFHLAGAGAQVTGIDTSVEMLERAEAHRAGRPDLAGRVHFHRADITAFESDARFGLVIFAYHGFMHLLTQAGQLAALRRMAAALREGGRLVIDLPNAAEAYAAEDEIGLVFERTFTDPAAGCTVMQQSISQIDRAAQQLTVTWVYDAIAQDGTVRRTLVPLVLRYTFLAEMDLLLAASGLRRVQCYGDYDGIPFDEGCPHMVVVAERMNSL